MNSNFKKKITIISIMLCSIIIVSLLATYAFIQASMNTKNQEASITTGTLALTFEDGSSSFQGSLDFGSSAVKTFSIENTGTLDASAVMYFDNLINTYTLGSLTYTLEYKETENGEYIEILSKSNVPRSETSTSRILSNTLMIPSKQKYFYKLTITLNYLEDVDQTSDLNAIFSSSFRLEEKGNKALDTVYALGLKTKEGSPDFALVATTDETSDGLYSMEDDYGTSYYFRGAVENNYVKFAGFYWRIVRINGDGSLRLIYDGTQAHLNGESNIDRVAIKNIRWNTNDSDAKYTGYMYGPSDTSASTSKEQAQSNIESSTIKLALDNWFENYISEEDRLFLADEIFCNDRTIPGKTVSEWTYDTELGYGRNKTAYGSWGRFLSGIHSSYAIAKSNPTPDLKCSQKNDAFTVKSEFGNQSLTYPIGLITADEINLSGSGAAGTANQNYYLYKGHAYWSMSPTTLWDRADIMRVNNTGDMSSTHDGGNVNVAPVINIKPEYAESMIGNGTMTNPYRLEEQEFSVPEAVKAIKNNKTPKAVNEGNPDFANPATRDEGIYAMEDDYGTSYYFRGSVENNYVQFAGFYWRIVRINGDGSLRLVYDGTSAHANGESSEDRVAIKDIAYNPYDSEAKYVGYMYGPVGTTVSTSKEEAQSNIENSSIKTTLDNWYKLNIKNKNFDKYISDTMFCNDRTTPGKEESGLSSDTGLGYGTVMTTYGAWSRNRKPDSYFKTSGVTAIFKCKEKNDTFTVEDVKQGNGNLTYPIGLLTSDEAAAGGLKGGNTNPNSYLYKGENYWLITPDSFNRYHSFVFYIGSTGILESDWTNREYSIAPVINIKPEYAEKMKGTGYMNDPYVIEKNF